MEMSGTFDLCTVTDLVQIPCKHCDLSLVSAVRWLCGSRGVSVSLSLIFSSVKWRIFGMFPFWII